MRVRIIFRGLTLFTFKNGSTENAQGGDNMGELTAWLMTDLAMMGMPLHEHTPSLGMIGRDLPLGAGRAQVKRDVPDELTLSLMGHRVPSGVRVAQSFLDYVPCLSALHWGRPTAPTGLFLTKRITIPSGTIRAREFISWDWHGNTPTKVAFMDTSFRGYAANEVIVDIGDDSDPGGQDERKYLMIQHGNTREQLWSYTQGSQLDHDIEPNTVELLFNNNTKRRRTSVFWGMHMMTLFDFVGYPRRRPYQNTTQYDAFVRAASAYDPIGWESDMMMGIGQPFPFLALDQDRDKLPAIQDVGEPYIIQGPPPHPAGQQPDSIQPARVARGRKGVKGGRGRRRGIGGMSDMSDMSGIGDMSGMGGPPGNDPVNIVICPQGRT